MAGGIENLNITPTGVASATYSSRLHGAEIQITDPVTSALTIGGTGCAQHHLRLRRRQPEDDRGHRHLGGERRQHHQLRQHRCHHQRHQRGGPDLCGDLDPAPAVDTVTINWQLRRRRSWSHEVINGTEPYSYTVVASVVVGNAAATDQNVAATPLITA